MKSATGIAELIFTATLAVTMPAPADVAMKSAENAATDDTLRKVEETARELANPNTPLASLTLRNQWFHWGGDLPGADGLDSGTLLFQPSFPFPLSKTDLIFCRPALPYLLDQPVADGSGQVETRSGFGDMGMDLAYGRTMPSGFIMVAGLVGGIPIGEDGLSSDTWTIGPEMALGRLSRSVVFVLFTSHQWDVSGPAEASLTTVQPIANFLPGGGWAIGTMGLMNYNWESEQWTVPLNLTLAKTLMFGRLPVRIGVEGNYYVDKSDALGQDWMVGLNITPVVPNILANWLGRD